MTMRITLGHGVAYGGPFEVMTVNLAGSAYSKSYGQSIRGTQSLEITSGPGSYGALKMVSSKVVAMEGANAVPTDSNSYVLGTSALYTCTSNQIHIRFFDNAALGSATFTRL